VLKELLASTPPVRESHSAYERIASSNAVILVFKIEEGPKVKVAKSNSPETTHSATVN